MLSNSEVIAVDQDPLGVQGTVVSQRGPAQVWSKPLAGGAVAVALLNRGSVPLRIGVGAGELGLNAARSYRVRDLWARTSSVSSGDVSALVAPDSVVLYRVVAGG
jgi:alpha-galactosidase